MSDAKGSDHDLRNMLNSMNFVAKLDEVTRQHNDAMRSFLLEFLVILDDLDRMIAQSSAPRRDLDVLQKQMLLVFERVGVEFLDALHGAFDPDYHHAVETVQSSGVQPDTIVEVIKRGCMFQGQLLRPAEVVVASE